MPLGLFRHHDWRRGIATLGTVPAEFVREVSEGTVDYDWPAQVGQLVASGQFDLILSVGQVVPHEVIGMANYNKNIFVGTGGQEGINRSHFLGAAWGMERIMGRADNPVRRVLELCICAFRQASTNRLRAHGGAAHDGRATRDTRALHRRGRRVLHPRRGLSLDVNIVKLDRPLSKVVVYLDPHEFRSTWLGNKSVYRTRMAIADGGELIVLGPGVATFGEDATIDTLIRRYGYVHKDRVLELVKQHEDLAGNLQRRSAPHPWLTRRALPRHLLPWAPIEAEIESVGFGYGDLASMTKRYDPSRLADGYNTMPDGEEIFYIPNPALGLWAHRSRF